MGRQHPLLCWVPCKGGRVPGHQEKPPNPIASRGPPRQPEHPTSTPGIVATRPNTPGSWAGVGRLMRLGSPNGVRPVGRQPLGMLSWPGHSPSCPVAPVPREQLGPWNTLSQSAAVGMMERQVIFNSGDSLQDRASSSPGEETSREGGDPNSRCSCLIPALPSLSPHFWA